MRNEDISNALGLLDGPMVEHALAVREQRKGRSGRQRIWRAQYAAAAGLLVVCLSAAAVGLIARYQPGNDRKPDQSALGGSMATEDAGADVLATLGSDAQTVPGSDMQNQITSIDSLMPPSTEADTTCDLHYRVITNLVKDYDGFYTELPSAGNAVLAESLGRRLDGMEDEWYLVSGHSDLQYLILKDGQEFSLWQFECFECYDISEYPYQDVLRLIYQIDSADAITEIEVSPARMDNSDEGIRIQEEIGTRTITDRAAIETMYEVLSGMTCYGQNKWELIDYGQGDMLESGGGSHEAVRLGRYLYITTDYGNTIGCLNYTAVSDMFYEFLGIAYNALTEKQAAEVCEIIGIVEE